MYIEGLLKRRNVARVDKSSKHTTRNYIQETTYM